ncbi:STAS domain-containing protein [Pseudomonadota bacterium]
MDINIRNAGEINILDFSGNLDTNSSPAAESEVNGLLEEGSKHILFNFSDLNFISSSGLRILLATAKKLKKDDGKMVVYGLNDVVQEVFDISGFATILNLAATEEEALASF